MPRDRKLFERTKARLLWAKKIHQRKGILGQGEGSSVSQQLIQFYRSNQWQSRRGMEMLADDELRIVNKIFPLANRQQAGIAARNPRVQYFAKSEPAQASVPLVESLHNHDIIEQNHVDQLNAALRDHQLVPFPGIVRHGYTPERELRDDDGKLLHYFRPAHPDRPWIRRVAPWNVMIDPSAESFRMDGGAMWCAFRSVMTIDQIQRSPRMIARERLKGFPGSLSPPWLDLVDPDLLPREDPSFDRYVEVWTFYDLEDRTWSQLTLDGLDEWLREPEGWPIPWEWLPYNAFQVNEQIDTPYPLALLEDVIPYQIELNLVRTMISTLTRNIRVPEFVHRDRLAEGEAEKIMSLGLAPVIFTTGPPGEVIQQGRMGSLPQELLQYAAMIVDDMRESTGISRFGRAQRENVESASEASFIQGGQDVIEQRTVAAFERFVSDVERSYMQGRKFLAQENNVSEIVRVLGGQAPQLLASFQSITADSLWQETDFEIVAGSTLPRNRERESAMALADMQALSVFDFVNNVELAGRYLDSRRIPRERALHPQALEADAQTRASEHLRGLGPEGERLNGSTDANLLALFQPQGGSA